MESLEQARIRCRQNTVHSARGDGPGQDRRGKDGWWMGTQAKVLVVEDDEATVEFITMGLEHEGHEAFAAHTGRGGLEAFRRCDPDLVILDLMLPDLDGIEVCRTLRSSTQVPILMLTARGDLNEKVLGLDSGADDYLSKPFRLPELLARVRALLRRAARIPAATLALAELKMDLRSRQVLLGDQQIELTRKEFDLLELFLRHPQQVLSRDQILSHVWGWEFAGDTNVVDVHVSALRAKLGPRGRMLLRTVRGIGYALGSAADPPR